MPTLSSSILEPLGVQFIALLPVGHVHQPLGCHRPRIPDRRVFDKPIQILVVGCGDRRSAAATCPCPASTLRRRRDQWIHAGAAEHLRLAVLGAYQRPFGLDLDHLAVESTGAAPRHPAAGRPPGRARWIAASKA